MIDRKYTLEHKHENVLPKIAPEVAVIQIKQVMPDGSIEVTNKQQVVDVEKDILKVPAYTTKIEYIQQYGTMDNLGEVHYNFARTSDLDFNIKKEIENIIINNQKE